MGTARLVTMCCPVLSDFGRITLLGNCSDSGRAGRKSIWEVVFGIRSSAGISKKGLILTPMLVRGRRPRRPLAPCTYADAIVLDAGRGRPARTRGPPHQTSARQHPLFFHEVSRGGTPISTGQEACPN